MWLPTARSLDDSGLVTDRRAGRIETEVCERLCDILASKIKRVGSAEVMIQAGKGHRFVVIFREPSLEGPILDTDPQREGLPIAKAIPADASSKKAQKAADLINAFYEVALPLLKDEQPANGFLMRGIAHQPDIQLSKNAIGSSQPVWRFIPCIKVWPNSLA